jgi:hypothetical protein
MKGEDSCSTSQLEMEKSKRKEEENSGKYSPNGTITDESNIKGLYIK